MAEKIRVAWISDIEEWRDIYDCDHGRYYCLDPGDGLGTHIGPEVQVLEAESEEEAERMMVEADSQRIPDDQVDELIDEAEEQSDRASQRRAGL